MSVPTSNPRRPDPRLRNTTLLGLLAALWLTGPATPLAAQVAPPAGNLGAVGTLRELTDQTLLAVSTEDGNVDLNGDGDTEDVVPFVVELRTGAATAVPVAGAPSRVTGRHVIFVVDEFSDGVDANGDGDTLDRRIPHLYDRRSGAVTNLGLASRFGSGAVPDDGLLIVPVLEEEQGATDLNGDGDADDLVPHVVDPETGVVTNLGLATSIGLRVGLDAGQALVFVDEGDQGGTDLNGNGFVIGEVPHRVDLATGAVSNLGLATIPGTAFALAGGRLFMNVSESMEDVDLDGDGAVFGHSLATADVPTLSPSLMGFSGLLFEEFQEAGPFLLVHREAFGSGDVLRIDPASGTAAVLGPYFRPTVSGPSALVQLPELAGVDLNGDGIDGFGSVAFLLDVATGALRNLGLSSTGTPPTLLEGPDVLDLSSTQAAWMVPELFQGGVDKNGDGDAVDSWLAVMDRATGRVTEIPLATVLVEVTDRLAAFLVQEQAQGADLNGDGDQDDLVLHVFDARSQAVVNTRAAIAVSISSSTARFSLQAEGNHVAFVVSEAAQGGLDLNGDGDADDGVVHLLSF